MKLGLIAGNGRFPFLLLLCCSFGLLEASGQEVVPVNANIIMGHLLHHVPPVYPRDASAAHVEGSVIIDARIGTSGTIESTNVVSGPEMLRQTAIDCVTQWTFRPFEKDGVRVIATGRIIISFSQLGQNSTSAVSGSQNSTLSQRFTVQLNQEKTPNVQDVNPYDSFDANDEACKKGVLAKQFNDATVSACRAAAILADQMPLRNNFLVKRSAFVFAASAYAGFGDNKDALPWAVKAVDMVRLGYDTYGGSHAAYKIKGTVEVNLNNLQSANNDLDQAENFLRKDIEDAGNGPKRELVNLKRILVQDLKFHARVLMIIGRLDESRKMLNEAADISKTDTETQ